MLLREISASLLNFLVTCFFLFIVPASFTDPVLSLTDCTVMLLRFFISIVVSDDNEQCFSFSSVLHSLCAASFMILVKFSLIISMLRFSSLCRTALPL